MQNKLFKMSYKQEFTLLELLVVVLIIGILAAVALPQYQFSVTKANFVQLVTAAQKLAEAEQRYYLEHNKYTKVPAELDVAYPTIEGDSVIFSKGECSLSYTTLKDDSSKRIVCKMTSPLVIWNQFLVDNRFTCVAYSGDNYKGDRFCRQLIGTKFWYNGCGSPACHVYSSGL